MGRLVDLLSSGKPLLWIEATAYAERLLAGGHAPWRDVAEFVAWHRKAQALLESNVVSLPVAPIGEAWRQADRDLAAAMAAKKRISAPLKVLLASLSLRAHIAEILRALRASYVSTPLALVVPSPRRWVGDAYASVYGEMPDVGEEETDEAAMYAADFLRAFGESRIDVLLLEESAASAPDDASQIRWYQPVLNVASHYRWDCGLRLPVWRDLAGANGIDFCIAPAPVAGLPTGLSLGESWRTGRAPDAPPSGFRYIEIPVDTLPEATLEGLAALRLGKAAR
jgi:hypothetical protein